MGLIGDFLTAGTKHRKERELEEELYAATHTCYKAYCRICGATSSGNFRTPEDAIRNLQYRTSGCGADMYDPQIREV